MKKIILKSIDVFYKYRFLIMGLFFCLCIIFKLSGSSIGCWENLFNLKNNDFLLGINRSVRADEWATFTPLNFAQVENGFRYFNTSLRGTLTDVFMIYALPVKCIFQIFRPFLLGYTIFGAERGLSFFWCGRYIALFLVSLDFFMVITKKNKVLSFLGSLMILLAPIIQWWFSINGIAELFIFGELIIVMIYKYLNTNSFIKRLLYLFITYISAGGYGLIMYPAWQIPMAFVFLALAIFVVIDNYSKEKIKIKDIISIIVMILLLGVSLLMIINKSLDTIKIVMNTSYPGSRFEVGGGQLDYLFSYISNIFLPFKSRNLLLNQPEQSLFFSLFPIGIILSIKELITNKKKDKLLIILLIAWLFFGIWCVLGFPGFLSKITLMSYSTGHRALLALGYIDVLLLIRTLSKNSKPFSKLTSLIITLVLTLLFMLKNIFFHRSYFNILMCVVLLIECIYLFYTSLRYNSKRCKYLFILGMIGVMLLCGSMVNPLRFGSSIFTKSEILNNVKKINKEDPGIWITANENYPVNNYIAISGVKTINVTNTYPDLAKWHKFDKNKEYEDIYNRYAHITINLENEEQKDKFVLINPDVFEFNASLKDLDTLNVKYIFTRKDLEEFNNDEYTFN